MKCTLIVWACYVLSLTAVFAQSSDTIPQRSAHTVMMSASDIPVIDGVLDEDIWSEVVWESNFKQDFPESGAEPKQQTAFKVLCDEKYIYVGFKCFDTEPLKIVDRLSRRDGFEGDRISIGFDSYNDKQTAFMFTISAAGVKGDELISSDGMGWDDSWNPIWLAKSVINTEGWTSELRIPLSQLRFSKASEQTWGLQVRRYLFRAQEGSMWQYVPREAPGLVSQFGTLIGIKNLEPQKQIEIQPYGVVKSEVDNRPSDHPFKKDKLQFAAGIAAKIGVTNDMTLDLTVNPDFGQVEADPAAINLDGFQIFFQEQRPFFVENNNIFDYGLSRSQAGNTFWSDNLFYSRRIGRSPSAYPSTVAGDVVDQPINTTILGAAKLSGKTKNGWSVGILESVTDNEYALIDNNGIQSTQLVEPLTNYFVGRLKKDFNNRNSQIGGILTSTQRKLDGSLDFLHSSAMTGAIDFEHRWKERSWYVSGNFIASQVNGSKQAIENTQRSFTHLFHREEADHLTFDGTKTSLTGTGGHIKLGRSGNGALVGEGGITWRSPELELNDIGFQRQSDDIRQFYWIGYRWLKPFSIFNRVQVNVNEWLAYDFGGNRTLTAFNTNSHFNFKNFWYAGFNINYTPVSYSYSELRGGPRFRFMPKIGFNYFGQSDGRKNVVVNWGVSYDKSKNKTQTYQEAWLGISLQPMNALSLRLQASYSKEFNQLQYVTQQTVLDKRAYILGSLDRETINLSLRINYTINPNLSIQYYGQPYVTSGAYAEYKHVINASSIELREKVQVYDPSTVSCNFENNNYIVDHDGNGSSDFEFSNPDFSYLQFRSNLVLRWEYTPGSEFFLVWTMNNSTFGNRAENVFNALSDQVFDANASQIFLLKTTYRFVR